ncbi:MAG: hypothetical protein EBR82_10165 [Caulobacteraceae bacterium]|nr:hypothetical protein [Caulobacteraceae bacterium]
MAKGRKDSRAKGANGERELAAVLRDMGFKEARRGQQFKGGQDSPDVANAIKGVHIECKRVEKLDLADAMVQSHRDSGGNIPCVMHRVNYKPWLVTLYRDNIASFVLLTMEELGWRNYDSTWDDFLFNFHRKANYTVEGSYLTFRLEELFKILECNPRWIEFVKDFY